MSDDASYECQVQPAVGEEGLRAAAHLTVLSMCHKFAHFFIVSGSNCNRRCRRLFSFSVFFFATEFLRLNAPRNKFSQLTEQI